MGAAECKDIPQAGTVDSQRMPVGTAAMTLFGICRPKARAALLSCWRS